MYALVALDGLFTIGLDICNAYLYGDLAEEIYIKLLEGLKITNSENKVLHLCKVLYRLTQAGLAWQRILDKSMKKLGFIYLKSNVGVFVKFDRTDRIIVIVYIDDTIFAS